MRVALCLHDLRLSQGANLPSMVDALRKRMEAAPVTCHIIADVEPEESPVALEYFRDGTQRGDLEVVFHGIAHRCPEGTGKGWAWYHKNQAEFLGENFDAARNAARFRALQAALRMRLGVCPPCWIASKSGRGFLESLDPLFLEDMLWLTQGQRRRFSPVVSLGGDSDRDLFFLRLIARGAGFASRAFRFGRLRLVVHPIDLERRGSLDFLSERFHSLRSLGYQCALQKNLL